MNSSNNSTSGPAPSRSRRRSLARRLCLVVQGLGGAMLLVLAGCTAGGANGPVGKGSAGGESSGSSRTASAPGPTHPGSPQSQWSSKGRSIGGSAVGGAQLAAPPQPFVVPQGGAARENARALLRQAIESPLPQLRAHAVEAATGEGRTGDPALATEFLQRGLVDANRGVRFVSAMKVGLLATCGESMLVEPLLRDESESVQAAAIFALMRCGRQVDPSPLARMLASDDPEVRGNAALVLGELGNPTALPMLRQAAGRGMLTVNPARVRIVELQIAEAQVKLGDLTAADPIRAALFAPPQQSEFAALACQIVGRVGDHAATAALERLIDATGDDGRPPEVRLAAASALAQLRPVREQDAAMAEEMLFSDIPPVRAQAAITLARMGRTPAIPAVQRLLSDGDPVVQVAAAGAILRLTSGN